MDNKGVDNSSRKLNKMHRKQVVKSKTHVRHRENITYINIFNKLKRTTKKEFYYNGLNRYKDDSKLMWQTLSSVIGKTNYMNNLIYSLRIDEENVNDQLAIADGFCKYFSEVGRTTVRFQETMKPAH